MHDLFQRFLSLPWDQLPQWLFLIPAAIMLLGAAGAVMFRNLIHCALWLVLSFAALAVLYIALGAEFVGFVQLLVYVGAVAILILFAILLTPSGEVAASNNPLRNFKVSAAVNAALGGLVTGLVLLGLFAAIFFSPSARAATLPATAATAPIAEIGKNLLSHTLLPLQAVAVLLTAALIGAALLAKEDKE